MDERDISDKSDSDNLLDSVDNSLMVSKQADSDIDEQVDVCGVDDDGNTVDDVGDACEIGLQDNDESCIPVRTQNNAVAPICH